MRTALISTLQRADDGTPLAFLELGGRPIATWQVDLALQLGCSRIICLGLKRSGATDQLQSYVEKKGAEFHLIGAMLQLVGQVTAGQEIVVIADGVVIDRGELPLSLESGRGVLAIPAEQGIAAGFERIDATHAWAGLMVARSHIVEQLAEMPSDSDIIALLLRLGLQAKTPLISNGPDWLNNGTVLLALDESVTVGREKALLKRSAQQMSWMGPGKALAARLVSAISPKTLQTGPLILGVAAIALLGGAIALSVFGFAVGALGAIGLGTFGCNLRSSLIDLKMRLYGESPKPHFEHYMNGLVDISLIVSMTILLESGDYLAGAIIPLLFVGLLRLAGDLAPKRWQPLASDRVVLAVVLALLSGIGVLQATLEIGSVLTLSILLILHTKFR